MAFRSRKRKKKRKHISLPGTRTGTDYIVWVESYIHIVLKSCNHTSYYIKRIWSKAKGRYGYRYIRGRGFNPSCKGPPGRNQQICPRHKYSFDRVDHGAGLILVITASARHAFAGSKRHGSRGTAEIRNRDICTRHASGVSENHSSTYFTESRHLPPAVA